MNASTSAAIKVIASNAVKEACAHLMPRFEQASGHAVCAIWGGTLDISRRVWGGEVVDLVILAAERIDDLIRQGRLKAGSRVDLARSGVGVAVRAGARKPDISSGAALRTALLAARSIVLSSGPSSVHMARLFERMGVAEEINAKMHQIGPGLPVAAAVARGEGEIGFTQVSELLGADGVAFVGALPAEVQLVTVWSAGVHVAAAQAEAATELVGFLRGAEAGEVFRRCGMEAVGDGGGG
jgi:molybdate transport system substrate-binding protein